MKKEKVENGWLSFAFATIALLGIIYGFIPQDCDIDAIYLNCRIKGSFFDYLGGAFWIAGPVINIWRTYNPRYAASRGDGNWKSVLPIFLMLLAIVLVWNL